MWTEFLHAQCNVCNTYLNVNLDLDFRHVLAGACTYDPIPLQAKTHDLLKKLHLSCVDHISVLCMVKSTCPYVQNNCLITKIIVVLPNQLELFETLILNKSSEATTLKNYQNSCCTHFRLYLEKYLQVSFW